MRTGNTILDVILEIAVIVIVAALINWVLGLVGAPSIVATIVWILAVVAVIGVLLRVFQGGGVGTRFGGPRRGAAR
jgi:hypothetical protein